MFPFAKAGAAIVLAGACRWNGTAALRLVPNGTLSMFLVALAIDYEHLPVMAARPVSQYPIDRRTLSGSLRNSLSHEAVT